MISYVNTVATTSCLPNLVIIGAMKSGTTSLHQYLNFHPEIQMSKLKELDFFVEQKNWKYGLEWYQSHFSSTAIIRGESSPNYTKYPNFGGVPERMSQIIPNAKLIYIVRDPVKRILSHYIHQYTNRDDLRPITAALSHLENNNYLNCSRYAMQLEQFLLYYPLSQILVLSFEELVSDRLSTLQRVFCFLGVDSTFEHPKFSEIFHQSIQKKRLTALGVKLFQMPGGGRFFHLLSPWITEAVIPPVIKDDLYNQLIEALQPDADRLRGLTGERFSKWSL